MVIESQNIVIELEYVKAFNNEHQARAYESYNERIARELEIKKKSEEKKLLIEKLAKTLTKITTIISSIAGAIAVVLESLIPFF